MARFQRFYVLRVYYADSTSVVQDSFLDPIQENKKRDLTFRLYLIRNVTTDF